MDGRIGIGAPLEDTPFVHVARLVAFGRFLADELASTEFEWAGEGRGEAGGPGRECGMTAEATGLFLPTGGGRG